ncbi:hypothetical protein EJB05_47981, partial [Eragrostis curvula]
MLIECDILQAYKRSTLAESYRIRWAQGTIMRITVPNTAGCLPGDGEPCRYVDTLKYLDKNGQSQVRKPANLQLLNLQDER